jgi:flagellar M-ring protein FliF
VAETIDGALMAQTGRDNSPLVDGFWGLQVLRQVGLMFGLAASVALGMAVVMWAQGKDYQPLGGGLERADMVGIAQVLEQEQIAYKVDTASGTVLVDSSQLENARMKLAAAGISAERGFGFESMDKGQPLGSSQFMENARYLRSMEGELARTIMSINGVRNARVHIAIPKASVFLRDKREVHASVLVEKQSGRDLDAGQVKAIASLVAASVPELDVSNVAVVDQNGKLLSQDIENAALALANQQLVHQREFESDMAKRVESILLPILGPDKFRAEVSADMDFSQVEQADETFNPDAPATRSEQTSQEQSGAGGQAAGIPGALANQPPAAGAAPEVAGGGAEGPAGQAGAAGGNNSGRSQATRNFELDRTVSYTKHQTGRLLRLSVAVVLDDQIKLDAEGKPQRTVWTEQELERMASLVRNAVGFSAARGDSVNVINAAFVVPEAEKLETTPAWEQPWLRDIMRPVMGGLVVLALLFGVLRPVLKNIVEGGQKLREEQMRQEMSMLGMQAGSAAGGGGAGGSLGATGGSGPMLLPSPEDSYEQTLNAVKGLIAQDSERVAQVVKQWVNEES